MPKKETELVKGQRVKGPDGRVGVVYKLYTQDNNKYVAITYAKHDYGMFKLSEITIV